MKILYVATQDDPLDLNAGSGSDYQLYHSFLRGGADVNVVGPFVDRPGMVERGLQKIHNTLTRKRYLKFSYAFLRKSAAAVERAIAEYQPDIVFAKNVAPLVYCNSPVPIVYRMDTTLKGSQQQWPLFSWLAYLLMLQWEKKVLRKTSLAITCSEWVADILRNYYSVPASDILIVPNPASLPEEVVPATLEVENRAMNPLHLLVVGREFERKGVDIAIEATNILNQRQFPAELRVVGLMRENMSHVRYMGAFKKTDDRQLREYVEQYRWADFLLHPARFEAAGIVPGEAAAFGVPTITNAAGGLATTVKHNVSGIVLPKDSPAGLYASTIESLLNDKSAYLALCRSARQRYELELNWRVAGDNIFRVMQALAGKK